MTTVDVLVVGAGPAGTSAAIWARRAGLDVTLVDRAVAGRDKCCGDGLTALALRELEGLGLAPQALDSWMTVDAAAVRTPRGRLVRLPLPVGAGQFAAACRRSELDAALMELAAAAGADLRLGIAFAGFDEAGRRPNAKVAVLSDGTRVAARFVIAADGVYSGVRKALGISPPRYRGDWHAFRGYRTAPRTAARTLWVWFEPDLLPGYAWSFPLGDGRVNFGFGVPRAGGGTLAGSEIAGIWKGLAERPHIREVLGAGVAEGPARAWPIPARLGEIEFTRGARAACRRRSSSRRSADRRGHWPGTSDGAHGGTRDCTRRTATQRRRPLHTLCAIGVHRRSRARASAQPRARARTACRNRSGCRRRVSVDTPPVRALDVRGLSPSGRGDPSQMASRHGPTTRRVRRCDARSCACGRDLAKLGE